MSNFRLNRIQRREEDSTSRRLVESGGMMQNIRYRSYLLTFVMMSSSIPSNASAKNTFLERVGIQAEWLYAFLPSINGQDDKDLHEHLTQCSLALHEQESLMQQKRSTYLPSYDASYEQPPNVSNSCTQLTHDIHEQLDALIAQDRAEIHAQWKQWYKHVGHILSKNTQEYQEYNDTAAKALLRDNPHKYLHQAHEQEVAQEHMHSEIARLARVLGNHSIVLDASSYAEALTTYQQALENNVALHACATAIDPDIQMDTWSSMQQEQSAEVRAAYLRLEAFHEIGKLVYEVAYLQDAQEQSDQVIQNIQQQAQESCTHEFDKADLLINGLKSTLPKALDYATVQGICEPSQPLGKREMTIITHLQPTPLTRLQWMWQKRYHIALGCAVVAGSLQVFARHKDELVEKAYHVYDAIVRQLQRTRAALLRSAQTSH